MRYYEDFEVGATWTCPTTYEVTADEIMEMGRRWDPQPFHTDPEAAAASPFGGLVASTVHLIGIITKIGMEADPVAAVSNLGMTDLVNHTPARPDDVLTFDLTTLDKRLSSSRPGVGVIRFRTLLRNQRD